MTKREITSSTVGQAAAPKLHSDGAGTMALNRKSEVVTAKEVKPSVWVVMCTRGTCTIQLGTVELESWAGTYKHGNAIVKNPKGFRSYGNTGSMRGAGRMLHPTKEAAAKRFGKVTAWESLEDQGKSPEPKAPQQPATEPQAAPEPQQAPALPTAKAGRKAEVVDGHRVSRETASGVCPYCGEQTVVVEVTGDGSLVAPFTETTQCPGCKKKAEWVSDLTGQVARDTLAQLMPELSISVTADYWHHPRHETPNCDVKWRITVFTPGYTGDETVELALGGPDLAKLVWRFIMHFHLVEQVYEAAGWDSADIGTEWLD